MDLLTVLVFLVVFLLCLWYVQRPDFGKYTNLPPAIPGYLPFIGHMLAFTQNKTFHARMLQHCGDLGDIIRLSIGSRCMILLNSTQAIREAFVKKADVFSERPKWMTGIRVINGYKGLIWGHEWSAFRRFALISLKDFGLGKSSLEERVVEEAKAVVDLFGKTGEKAFTVNEIMPHATSNVICSVVFGNRFSYDDENFKFLMKQLSSFVQKASLINPTSFIRLPMFLVEKLPLVRKGKKTMSSIQHFLARSIAEHRETYDGDNIRDFIDLFIQNEEKQMENCRISESDFFRMIMDLFIAGTETTSTTLQWVLLYMILHPEIQAKCKAEIQEVVGSRSPRLDDRRKLPYVEATLLEVQRIASTAAGGLPHVASQDTELNGFQIPQGSLVLANIYACHMDPKVWNKPHEFNPDRWLDKDNKIIRHEAFLPFSTGKRVCLGEQLAKTEIFLFTVCFLQDFTFKVANGTCKPSTEPNQGVTRCPKIFELIACHEK